MGPDLRHPFWIYLKAVLLLTAGALAGGILLYENASLRTAGLLGMGWLETSGTLDDLLYAG